MVDLSPTVPCSPLFGVDVIGSVVCWPTNLGWMMGPWVLYATLLNGGTLALYHGAPLGRDFGQFVAAARVEVLGVVPSIVKAWRASGCMEGVEWPALRCFSSTGRGTGRGRLLAFGPESATEAADTMPVALMSKEDARWKGCTERAAGAKKTCGQLPLAEGYLPLAPQYIHSRLPSPPTVYVRRRSLLPG